jgi:hypothetical protein
VGTSMASTSILDVALGTAGNALNLNILSDKGLASIDPKVASPAKAVADLSPLRIASGLLPALNQTVPGLHAESTGAANNASVPAIPLNVAPILTGTLTPPNLSALVDSTGAVGGITAGLSNFNLVGGLLSIPNASLNLGAKALKGDSDGSRGIKVDSLDLVNIAGLLRGLGIDPANLPLNTVTGLLDKLGIALPVGTSSLNGAGITGLVTQLSGGISGLQAAITGASGGAVTVPPVLGSLLGTLTTALPAIPALPGSPTTTTALPTLTGLTSQLTNLLNSTLGGLLNSPLLSLKGIEVGLNTKAADTVGNSLAGVTAKIGSLKIGALPAIGGIDLGAPLAQVTGLVDQVNTTLSGILSTVNPGLGGLLKLGVFTQDKQVSESGGYTHALASLSALHLAVNPLAAINGVVTGLLQPTGILGTLGLSSVSSLLTGATSAGGAGATSVPVVAPLMQQLNTLLGTGALGALAGGVSADLVKVASTSDFALVGAAPVSPAPVSELPMTGGSHFAFVLGLLFLATGAGLVRWMRVTRSEA